MVDKDHISNSDSKSGIPSTLQDQETAKAEQQKPREGNAPDGGAAAWLVVLGAWCVSFCSFGWLNSKGYIPFLGESFKLIEDRRWGLPGVL